MFNTDRILKSILILEEYGLGIEYIQGNKNIVTYALSIFPIIGNQETTHKSTYKNRLCQISTKLNKYLRVFYL